MKRYLLFAGNMYYPGGGWRDFVNSFETFEEAKDQAYSIIKCGRDWYQIVDAENGVVEWG